MVSGSGNEIRIALPAWLADFESEAMKGSYPNGEARMALAVALAERNLREGSGGPFGAAVFGRKDGRLVVAGVNCVLSSGLSVAHAEVIALTRAQAAMGTHDLWSADLELYASAQPCVMCYGAFWWSGVRGLCCGARSADVEAIVGFREGPLASDWEACLERRGISVRRDLLREEACAVLRAYAARGAPVYNPEG